jgi:hypothetical protein
MLASVNRHGWGGRSRPVRVLQHPLPNCEPTSRGLHVIYLLLRTRQACERPTSPPVRRRSCDARAAPAAGVVGPPLPAPLEGRAYRGSGQHECLVLTIYQKVITL